LRKEEINEESEEHRGDNIELLEDGEEERCKRDEDDREIDAEEILMANKQRHTSTQQQTRGPRESSERISFFGLDARFLSKGSAAKDV
jgi:hypothetical protein